MAILLACQACSFAGHGGATYATPELWKENTKDHCDLLLKVTGSPDNITGRPSTPVQRNTFHDPAVVDLAVAHLSGVVIPNQRHGIAKVAWLPSCFLCN